MIDRREFLGTAGFAALAVGALGPHAMARLAGAAGPDGNPGFPDRFGLWTPPDPTRPFTVVDRSGPTRLIGGYRVSDTFTGDWPGNETNHPPLEDITSKHTPDETADVVVVGGGISGMTSAYLLRDHKPIVLEFFDNFGGNARGEVWGDTPYSLGSAYIITPDSGTFLDDLYTEIGLADVVRVDEGPKGNPGETPVELRGRLLNSGFWDGGYSNDPNVHLAFQRYRDVVLNFANDYPEIPLVPGGADAVRALDRITLKDSIETGMGMPAPEPLAAAVQAYCYASFGAGWEEISAASGWNFLAAEEFGRWVFPGGNTYIVNQMWKALRDVELKNAGPGSMLRAGCRVYDVRLDPNAGAEGAALVTYADPSGALRTIRARRVVMSCQKFVAKYVVKDVATLDPPKFAAMNILEYRPYVVANVALKTNPREDFYDIFQLGGGVYPHNTDEASRFDKPTDVTAGHFNVNFDVKRGVLTFYWPLSWGDARFRIVEPANKDPLGDFAALLAPHLDNTLRTLGLTPADVDQIRFTRWGHALPLSVPNFIADGHAENLVRSFEGTIHWVSQDNWALPAVENCLLDAQLVAQQIDADLSA